MAVQPVHHTREEALTEALGARVPVEMIGRFTLYGRTKVTHCLYVHDKANGPESLPVRTIDRGMFGWSVYDGDEEITGPDPRLLFADWVARR